MTAADWLTACMIAGAIVLVGAIGYTAYRSFFSEPWLVQGTWEPASSVWPQPALHYRPAFSVLAITTREGWGFTPSRYFMDRAESELFD
jgi:hypothetical protein